MHDSGFKQEKTMFSTYYYTVFAVTLLSLVTEESTASQLIVVQQGETATLQFETSWPSSPLSNEQYPIPYFTLRFDSNQRPFCVNGWIDKHGLLHINQHERFEVVRDINGSSLVVNLFIQDVQVIDEGSYIFTVLLYGFENTDFVSTTVISLQVIVPPGRAECFISESYEGTIWLEVHCRATTGTGDSTLSCFQQNNKLPYKDEVVNEGIVMRGIFWFMQNEHLHCCSHDHDHATKQESCQDFVLSPNVTTTTKANPKFDAGGAKMNQRDPTEHIDNRSVGTSIPENSDYRSFSTNDDKLISSYILCTCICSLVASMSTYELL